MTQPPKIAIDDHALSVSVTDAYVTVTLKDGRIIAQPTWWTPNLLTATAKQRCNFRLLGGGVAICWPDVDADICVGLMLFPRGSTGCVCGS